MRLIRLRVGFFSSIEPHQEPASVPLPLRDSPEPRSTARLLLHRLLLLTLPRPPALSAASSSRLAPPSLSCCPLRRLQHLSFPDLAPFPPLTTSLGPLQPCSTRDVSPVAFLPPLLAYPAVDDVREKPVVSLASWNPPPPPPPRPQTVENHLESCEARRKTKTKGSVPHVGERARNETWM